MKKYRPYKTVSLAIFEHQLKVLLLNNNVLYFAFFDWLVKLDISGITTQVLVNLIGFSISSLIACCSYPSKTTWLLTVVSRVFLPVCQKIKHAAIIGTGYSLVWCTLK